MISTQSQPGLWAITVASARDAIRLYFEPLRRVSKWLVGLAEARVLHTLVPDYKITLFVKKGEKVSTTTLDLRTVSTANLDIEELLTRLRPALSKAIAHADLHPSIIYVPSTVDRAVKLVDLDLMMSGESASVPRDGGTVGTEVASAARGMVLERALRSSQRLGQQDAYFATQRKIEAVGLFCHKGVRLGYYRAPDDRKTWGKVIRYDGDGGLILVGPSRSGKARDVLIPALLEYGGSCVVIDANGQLAAVTKAQRERMGQQVIVLNPFNLFPDELGTPAKYNPMSTLDPEADSFGADCDSLADAIVTRDEHRNDYWPDSARQLVSGIVMHLAMAAREDEKNLSVVRRLISGPMPALEAFIDTALASDHDGFIAERLARFDDLNKGSHELHTVIATANTQTGFIGNKAITESLSSSDFRFRELKRRPMTVYLVLPTRYLDTCGKWLRVVIASALADLWSEEKGRIPVLAVLDEFAQLGRLRAINSAMGQAAGSSGLQLWSILQDLTQVQELYGEQWETFLANADVKQFFAPRGNTTAEYVAKLCGVRRTTQGQSVLPLLHPHSVSNLGPNESLIFGPGHVVIDGLRQPYFHTPEFKGLYCPDPQYKADAEPPPVAPESVVTFADTMELEMQSEDREFESPPILAS